MNEHTFWKIVAGSLVGAIAFILLVGLLYGMALDNIADDCEQLGGFAYGDRVFDCSLAGNTEP